MLRWRLPLGVLLIAALAGLCWLDLQAARPGIWLLPVSLIVCGLTCGELLWLMRSAAIEVRGPLVYAGNLSIVAGSWLPWLLGPRAWQAGAVWPGIIFVGWVLAAFVVEIVAYRRPGGVTARLAATVFALAYGGLLLSFLVLLRLLGGASAVGMGALLSLVCVVKASDIGAYTVGRLVGRHKLAPYLSPGKTIEGGVGGLAAAACGAWFALAWLMPRLVAGFRAETWQWIAFGLIVGVAGMVGDLAESLLKRDVGQKDSSRWLPGFGGVLDIVDSVLFAAPVAYVCWRSGLAGLYLLD